MRNIILIIDNFTEVCGRLAAWFVMLMMFITSVVVVSRRGFDIGSIAMQELIVYCHAVLIMFGIAYALKHDKHVRVDIFYRQYSAVQKAWVNALGTIFLLLPFSIFLLLMGWDFFLPAWQVKEGSSEPGGLPFVYLLKFLLVLMPTSVILQALALLLRDGLLLVYKSKVDV